MLKFIKHHMETIAGIDIFPLISLMVFFTFFILLLVWVIRSDKQYIRESAEMPLHDDSPETTQTTSSHE